MEAWLTSFGPWTVAVLALATSAEYVFPLVPGRILLVAAALSVARGDCGAGVAFAALTAAGAVSAAVQFQVGAHLRERFLAAPSGRTLGLGHAQVMEVAERLRTRARAWMVLGEFVPFVRSVRFCAAAVAGMGPLPALGFGLLPVTVRNGLVFGFAGSVVGDEAKVRAAMGQLRWVILVLAGTAVVTLLWPWLRARLQARAVRAGS